jgi:hypothetical protein
MALLQDSVARHFLRELFRAGTFPPFSLASLRPIAMACFRLFTLRPELLFSVPFLRRRIADFTRFCADLPYLAMELRHAYAVPECVVAVRLHCHPKVILTGGICA